MLHELFLLQKLAGAAAGVDLLSLKNPTVLGKFLKRGDSNRSLVS
jgi:hypothetical protein